MNLIVNDHLTIPADYLSFSFSRSSGPGGQNVNKVNTRAQLRFDLKNCPVLSEAVKKRLTKMSGPLLTQEGILLIESDEYRQQSRNREACLMRLAQMIRQALIPPKKRRPTRPTRGSIENRLAGKKHRGRLKSQRRENTDVQD